MNNLATWMENSAVASFIGEYAWVFPMLETFHFIGLILTIGAIYVIDLRLMGFAPRIPLHAVVKLIPVSLFGFAINLVTGVMFLFSDPSFYFSNTAFRLKVLAILIAGLNAVWFKFSFDEAALAANPNAQPAATIKLIGFISLLVWTCVIVLGRVIPYVA
jgi:hypothetical protein